MMVFLMNIPMKYLLLFLVFTQCIFAQDEEGTNVKYGTIKAYSNFESKYVDPRKVEVWLPDNYDTDKKFSVIYMHDGQNLFDAERNWNKQAWDVDHIADYLYKTNSTKDFIVVAIWNNGAKRHPEYFPQKPYNSLTQEQKNTISTELKDNGYAETENFTPLSDNYLKFIVTELKPFIDKNYSTYTNKENTIIAGSSMGGLISMYAVCEYPKVFGTAICMSTHWPGTFAVDNNPVPEAFVNYLNQKLPKAKSHKFYFDSGDQDLDALYPPLQEKVDAVFTKKGYTYKNWLTKYYPGKNHSEAAWKERFNIPLEFILAK
jgi:predicted alpha/beta superfamily hydrolase